MWMLDTGYWLQDAGYWRFSAEIKSIFYLTSRSRYLSLLKPKIMDELFSFKNKKFTWRSVVFLVGLVGVFFVLQLVYKKGGIDRQLASTANEINKNCPMMIDSITRLDNTRHC